MKSHTLLTLLFIFSLFTACSDTETSNASSSTSDNKNKEKTPVNLSFDLVSIKKSNQLVVVTVNAPRIYYKWRGRMMGLFMLINSMLK